MSNRFLKIHPSDNVYVALTDLKAGEKLTLNGGSLTLVDDVPAKHKFLEKPLQPEEEVIMYGTVVGKALSPIKEGGVIGTHNIKHKAAPYSGRTKNLSMDSTGCFEVQEQNFHGLSPCRWTGRYSKLLAGYTTGVL